MRRVAIYVLCFSLLLVNCEKNVSDKKTIPLFELLTPEQTGVDFSNQLSESEELNIITFEYFYNGAGVAVGDVNNDGLQDIFFAANMVNSRLYLNKGNFKFEDVTKKAGINTEGKWATGVSMVDINGDGWLDIYVSCAGPYDATRRANQFYINNGLTPSGGFGGFTEKAQALGLADTGHTTQAAFFDYDRDGDLDVYLLTNIMEEVGPNVIRPKKLNGESPNTDRLYRNDMISSEGKSPLGGFRGLGTFTNVSREAGILKEGYGLGVSIADFNQDGWLDIYVSNDYLSNDLLYINNGASEKSPLGGFRGLVTFTDKAADYFRHTSYSAMGNDVADFNNDGWLDIVAVDMLPPDNLRRKLMFPSINYDRFRSEIISGYYPQYVRNTLQLNCGKIADSTSSAVSNLAFAEIGQLAGIQSTDWSWSALFGDVDNDGWKDLLITNGYPRDITNLDFVSYKMNEMLRAQYNNSMKTSFVEAINSIDGAYLPNYIFKNKGDLTFQDYSKNWGFTQPSYSHGAALADLDNDGDLDYVVNNMSSPAFIYKNRSETFTNHHYLRLELKGDKGNPAGFGTKVWLYAGGKTQFQEMSPYRGFQSSVEPFLHFGLDSIKTIDSLKVLWLDGKVQVLKNIPANRVLKMQQKDAQEIPKTLATAPKTLFKEVSNRLKINYQHIEEHYPDFKIQPLLPHKHSEEGPRLAVGDMNGDGLEDFFVGGSFKHSGDLFFQQKDGTFQNRPLTTGTKYEEDLGCLLFDADQDGDLDLYLTSGSSEFPLQSPYYQDRLYKNNGKGDFQLDVNALPKMYSSKSCVVAADYDADGDQDLFVGGRIVPGDYAAIPRSYLLQNQGGKFAIATQTVCPELENIGRVTTALWTDFNKDNRPDLVLAGEWMPILFFQNKNSKLEKIVHPKSAINNQQSAINNSKGWWNTLAAADLDGDGDTDFVAGNLGLNTPYKADNQQSTRLYIADFNQNGKPIAVLTYHLQGKEVPVHFRNDLLTWLFPLKKQFNDYTSYAQAGWQDIYPKAVLKNAQVLTAQTFTSVWIENKNGAFEMHPLPVEAQFAPVQSIVIQDFNKDGKADILLAGNSFATETHTGRYDAMNGLLLLGDGKGNFQSQTIAQSGFYLPGDARALALLKQANGKSLILATRNNDTMQAFYWKK